MLKKNYKTIAYFFIFTVMAIVFTQCKNPVSKEDIKEYTDGINKKCPLIIDEYTILTQCNLVDDNTIKYTHVILNLDISKVDKKDFSKSMKTVIQETLDSDVAIKDFKDAGVTFIFSYLHNDTLYFEQKMTKQDYK